MATLLPGMPLAASDVFVCSIPDGGTPPAPRRHLAAVPPAPRRRRPVWLVLAGCGDCVLATGRYCREHDKENWWLRTMASAKRPGNGKTPRPES